VKARTAFSSVIAHDGPLSVLCRGRVLHDGITQPGRDLDEGVTRGVRERCTPFFCRSRFGSLTRVLGTVAP
jgi:hypothetical protein